MKADPRHAAIFAAKESICAGLASGSSGLHFGASGAPAGSIVDLCDPLGWHAMPEGEGTRFRRARRIDIQHEHRRISIDAFFQDSASTPEGDRSVVHEYRLRACADPADNRLLTVEAKPRVLPFAECLGAVDTVTRLVGTPLSDLRTAVLDKLRGTAGCTHLNDALRALAEVAVLSRVLLTPQSMENSR